MQKLFYLPSITKSTILSIFYITFCITCIPCKFTVSNAKNQQSTYQFQVSLRILPIHLTPVECFPVIATLAKKLPSLLSESNTSAFREILSDDVMIYSERGNGGWYSGSSSSPWVTRVGRGRIPRLFVEEGTRLRLQRFGYGSELISSDSVTEKADYEARNEIVPTHNAGGCSRRGCSSSLTGFIRRYSSE